MRILPSPDRPVLRGRPGFSFVELMVAMVVAAAVMAMVYPRLVPMRERAAVRSTKQLISAYLATARQSAIRRNMPATFHKSGNTVWVTAPDSLGNVQTISPKVDLKAQHGVTLAASPALDSVRYNARGLAAPRFGGQTTLTLQRGSMSDAVCVTTLGMVGKCGL